MKIDNKILFLLVLTTLFGTSCEKWLTVDTKDRIMENKLFSTQDGFLVALNGVYVGMIQSSLYNGKLTYSSVDIMAQYYDCTKEAHSGNKLSKFDKDSFKHVFDDTWSTSYALIANVNTIIDHCDAGGGIIDETHYNLFKGEALALRAFLHFDLLRIYGQSFKVNKEVESIPYQDYSDIKPSPILKSSAVAEKIMNDLYEAERLLEKSDMIITQGPGALAKEGESNDMKFRNIRMNYYAVKALIARVSLFFDDEKTALKYAKDVIEETQEKNNYFPFPSQAQMSALGYEDKVYSSEIIFASYNMKRSKDIYDRMFSNNLKTDNSYNQTDAAVKAFYEGMEDADFRYKFQWGKLTNASAQQVNVLTKFKIPDSKHDPKVNKLMHEYYVPLIRMSEMYLIKAECLMNTDEEGAYQALNTIRRARNAPSVQSSPDKTFVERLQWEYAREFIGEGQLFWFYKRYNMTTIPNIGLGPKDGKYVDVSTDSGQFSFDIPEVEKDKRK